MAAPADGTEKQDDTDSRDHAPAASIALEEWRSLAQQAWGALNFILAFYEPGQSYLDTNAWKQAEASGRRAHAALRAKLDAPSSAAQVVGDGSRDDQETQNATGGSNAR